MKKLFDIIQMLKSTRLPNDEILYSLEELKKTLDAMQENTLEVEDCVITPYYVCKGRRMELYAFEFNVRIVDAPDFNKYVLSKTGKRRMEDIPEEIIIQQKICYCEIAKPNNALSKDKIQQYIQYLYDNRVLKKEIQSVFGKFDVEKILFEFY